MSRRVAGPGSLLLAGLLLGSLALAAPATGQQSDRLQVKLRDSEAAAGRLKVTVAMSGPAWTGERLDQGDFTATIDGQPVQGLKATPLQEQQGSSGQLAVFLAVDTSGSMLQNDNIGTARRAAANFAGQMRPGTQMGVISFANDPKVVQLPTDGTGQVGRAIQALKVDDPQGDTALYDAVVLASRQLAGQPGQRNLFVLSDGRHEGTPTTLGQAIAAAKKAKVKVFTVGLEVPSASLASAAWSWGATWPRSTWSTSPCPPAWAARSTSGSGCEHAAGGGSTTTTGSSSHSRQARPPRPSRPSCPRRRP